VKGILIRRYFWCFVTLSKLITWLFGNPSAADKRSTGRPLLNPPPTSPVRPSTPHRSAAEIVLFSFTPTSLQRRPRSDPLACKSSLSVSLRPCHRVSRLFPNRIIWVFFTRKHYKLYTIYTYRRIHVRNYIIIIPNTFSGAPCRARRPGRPSRRHLAPTYNSYTIIIMTLL